MSHFRSETNKRLYHSQYLIQQASQEQGNAEESLRYAAWLSLRASWDIWCQELFEHLHLPAGQFSTFADLYQAPFVSDPAIQHLINLKETPDSWLSILLSQIDGFLRPAVKHEPGKQQKISPGLIASDAEEPTEQAMIEAVFKDMKAYIQFTREQQVEW